MSTLAPEKNIERAAIALEHAFLCCRVGEDNKAKNILVLDMREITPIFDFLVLMTGSSRRQIHTLAEEIDSVMQAEGEKRLTIEGYQSSRWVVQDYGDIVVHVFDPESRDYYSLEDLWADAKQLDWKNG